MIPFDSEWWNYEKGFYKKKDVFQLMVSSVPIH